MKKEKKNKSKSINIIFFVLCFLLGLPIGYVESQFAVSITEMVLLLVALFLFAFVSIIIHEAGHLVMGLLTGYEFLSFRVGSFTLLKENGRFVRKKFSIAGTGGQCLMKVKETEKPEDMPYFWYHFGGGFFNLISAVLLFIIGIALNNDFFAYMLIVFSIWSAFVGLINLIPMKSAGVPNDGYNIYLLHKSPENRILMYRQLLINGNLYDGKRLADSDDKLFEINGNFDDNTLKTAIYILSANKDFALLDFLSAERKFEAVINSDNIIELYKNECKCELMFCKIMNGCDISEVESLYDKKLKAYIKNTEKTYISRKRLMYAYYLIVKNDISRAEKEYDLAVKMENTYPCKGEYDYEMDIIRYIKNRESN